jgi:hypothetical protein
VRFDRVLKPLSLNPSAQMIANSMMRHRFSCEHLHWHLQAMSIVRYPWSLFAHPTFPMLSMSRDQVVYL